MSNRLIVAMAVVLVAAGAWMAFGPRPGEDAPAVAATEPARAPAPARAVAPEKLSASAVLAIDPRPNPLRPANAVPVKATLFNEFLGARQYRALYDRLIGSPEGMTAEGRLVLYELLRACANITEGRRPMWKPPQAKRDDFVANIAPGDPQKEKRIAAYDEFTTNRCQGLEGVTITQADLDKMLVDAASAGDPRARAMSIEQDLMIARRTQGRDAATLSNSQIDSLKQILASKDPEAIRVAGRVLSNSWSDYALRLGADQQPVDQRAFMNAWLVLACEYGQPCGADTPRLQQACAFQGHCDAQTFPDYLYFYGSSPYDSQMLVQYRGLLRAAIETGDWSQLNVVRGLPNVPNRTNFVPGPR